MSKITLRERLFHRWGSLYFLWMLLFTRVVAILIAGLCFYYMQLSLNLDERETQFLGWSIAGSVFFIAIPGTVGTGWWELRRVRRAVNALRGGQPLKKEQGEQAAQDAIRFPLQHGLFEAVADHFMTGVLIALVMRFWVGSSWVICFQVMVTSFIGCESVALETFFISESSMAPVIRYLQRQGVRVDFQKFQQSKLSLLAGLQGRMISGFGLIMVIALTMVGMLAITKSDDIAADPSRHQLAVQELKLHSAIISIFGVFAGGLMSSYLAYTISSRTARMVGLMKEVQAGNLSVRLEPTGTDEIDGLTRNFNDMINVLENKEKQIGTLNQDLAKVNEGLEQEVKERTAELVQSQHELQESFDKLKQYDQLKTQFFATVSHELRTPLTAILTPLDQALDDGLKRHTPEALELFQLMHASGERLLKRINQLLDFAKLDAGRMELHLSAVNVNQLVRQLIAISRPIAEKGRIRLDCALDERIPDFAADEERLDMSITNLLSNALKFTGEGGQVCITTRLEGDRVVVAVTDTGTGIARQHLEMIFEDFTQIDGSLARRYDGTGLGLPFTKKLVELHGGRITVESEPDAGSTFTFWIPCRSLSELTTAADVSQRQKKRKLGLVDHQSDDLDERTVLAQVKPPGGQAPLILVVEDTPYMRYLLARELAGEYRLEFAHDGRAGWEQARKLAPDLILSDVMMPGMNGYELCQRVKSNPALYKSPFVLLTAKAEVDKRIHGLDQGADDYVLKPFNARELRARIRSLIKVRTLSREVEARNHELQAALDELRTTQAKLVQSEKMASLGQLAAGIAHEINNSINFMSQSIRPLKLESESLRQQIHRLKPELSSEDEELRESLEVIHAMTRAIEEGATRTTRIVRDLRTFSHPGSGVDEGEPIDLHRSLDMCLTLLGGELKERITVHRHYGSRRTLYGPQGQLNQVLLNILNNAQQAISGAGEITIRTRDIGDEIELQIQDTGCGIPAENLPRIFDLFYTTKPVGVGTGMGLSLAYSIIHKLGGRLDCQSQVGVGTTFTILLPHRPRTSSSIPPRVHLS